MVRFSEKAEEYGDMVIAARTHNVAAQPTTFGRRLAMFGEELLIAMNRIEYLIENYPVRGIKGAVGTQVDQLTLFNGDGAKVEELEKRIVEHLGIKTVLKSTGQVYPRSIDFDTVTALHSH